MNRFCSCVELIDTLHEGVDQSVEAVQRHRDIGRSQSNGIRLAFVTQRIKLGCLDECGREST